MTESTLTTLTPDELVEHAHAAAAEADAAKERVDQERQAEQARQDEARRRELADQLRALIRDICGFDTAITPDDLDQWGDWFVHPLVALRAERCIPLHSTGQRWRLMAHVTPYGRDRWEIQSLADLSKAITRADERAAQHAAERDAKRRQQDEATRVKAERDARQADLQQQRAAVETDEPQMPAPMLYLSTTECSDGLLLVPAGSILDVYLLEFVRAHPLYLLSLHQDTIERLLQALESDSRGIITAGLQTIAVMDDDGSDTGVSITWIKESDDGQSHTGWVVHQRWAATDFTDGLNTWLAFRQAVRDWEARLRVIDDRLHALYATDF